MGDTVLYRSLHVPEIVISSSRMTDVVHLLLHVETFS